MPTPPATAARSPHRDRAARTAARVAAVLAATAAAVACLWAYGNRHDFFDLRIYVSAMRWWADGHDLYDYVQPDSIQGALYFTYPPFTAVLLRPFAYAPLDLTIVLFTAATVAALAVTTWWLMAPVADRLRLPRWYAAGLAIPLFLVLEPTRETLTFGQINMLLIVLILADVLFGVPRNARWAGVGIGLATALKLFPGIFILYLLAIRRWRAAAVAGATAAAATLFAVAIAPRASWQFWTEAFWSTERVGRTAYTANQSLLGLLGRLALPGEPSRLLWLALVVIVGAWGLWRAARVTRAGDLVAGVTLAGLVGLLVSPITWPHHVYWFVPAIVVLFDAAWSTRDRRGRLALVALVALAFIVYAVAAFGVVSFVEFGPLEPVDGVGEFLVRDAYALLAIVLIAVIPARATVYTIGEEK
jgi:alpha-1,2-mannosyltransferase